MEIIRKIVFYKNYFEDFFETVTEKVKDKIDEVLFMMTILERIPSKFFKSIEGVKGLHEVRVEYGGNIYRIFCCFDKGNLVILFNGFKRKRKKLHQRSWIKPRK